MSALADLTKARRLLVEKNEEGQLSVEEILPVRFSSLSVSH